MIGKIDKSKRELCQRMKRAKGLTFPVQCEMAWYGNRGGSVGWRFAQFYPKRTLAIAVFCTPYSPPNKEYIPLEDVVKRVPNFRYQLRLSSSDCDQELDADPEQFFRRLLRPCNEGVGPMYDADKDSIIQGRPKVERSKALSENQMKYYVDQYKKTGFHGPLNWYRTTKVRFEESKGKVQNYLLIFFHK